MCFGNKMWVEVLFSREPQSPMLRHPFSLCLGDRQCVRWWPLSMWLLVWEDVEQIPRPPEMEGSMGKKKNPYWFCLLCFSWPCFDGKSWDIWDFLLLGKSQTVPNSWERCKSCPVDKCFVRADFCLHVSTKIELPFTEELLQLQFQTSCKTTVPKLLSASPHYQE